MAWKIAKCAQRARCCAAHLCLSQPQETDFGLCGRWSRRRLCSCLDRCETCLRIRSPLLLGVALLDRCILRPVRGIDVILPRLRKHNITYQALELDTSASMILTSARGAIHTSRPGKTATEVLPDLSQASGLPFLLVEGEALVWAALQPVQHIVSDCCLADH